MKSKEPAHGVRRLKLRCQRSKCYGLPVPANLATVITHGVDVVVNRDTIWLS